MGWKANDGTEHRTENDRDVHDTYTKSTESSIYGDLDKGTNISGRDWVRMGNFMALLIPAAIGTIAMCGILVPFTILLRECYLIHITASRHILISFIAALVLIVPLAQFVIFPIMNGEGKVLQFLVFFIGGAIGIVGFLNGAFSLFAGVSFINSQIDTGWRNSFYSVNTATVSADSAVLRAAPATGAKAVLTLERGEEFTIYGDTGSGWYFAREREINNDIRNYGYVQADSVTLDDPSAKVKTMQPAALIVDNSSIHRGRRWNSWQIAGADKGDYVLATGRSRGGWTPVYKANTDGWTVGYMNDALLYFDDGNFAAGSGAKASAELKGVDEVQWEKTNMIVFNSGNERYRYAELSISGQSDFMRNLIRNKSDRYTEVPPGGRVIVLENQTKRRMSPVVYNGRMGWRGYLDWERSIRAEELGRD